MWHIVYVTVIGIVSAMVVAGIIHSELESWDDDEAAMRRYKTTLGFALFGWFFGYAVLLHLG